MTELKTLKDLKKEDCYCNAVVNSEIVRELIDIEDLKAEAIKWVKLRGECEASDVLMDFFNLTEEDLK